MIESHRLQRFISEQNTSGRNTAQDHSVRSLPAATSFYCQRMGSGVCCDKLFGRADRVLKHLALAAGTHAER
jgi:hypothetical protein